MNIKEIIKYATKPNLYDKGTAMMWTDEYISEQLLQVHLNPELDLASRKEETIDRTVEWIISEVGGNELNLLDLGCGPGLYAEKLAAKGHKVTGVDFSKSSIEYAREQTKKNKSGITYINESYLNLELAENTFDLVIMIYTDFGVLLPDDRKKLLEIVRRILKPGGTFIFDVLNNKDLENKVTPKNWEASENGFWRAEPYIALSESFLYEEKKIILYQHIIIDEKQSAELYRFWTHHFSHDDVRMIMEAERFGDISFCEDVLPSGDLWDGDNVTFCKTVKKK